MTKLAQLLTVTALVLAGRTLLAADYYVAPSGNDANPGTKEKPFGGMPDVPEYMAGIRHKQRMYRANEIPALFVYPEHLRGPGWPEKLVQRIYQAGRQAARYTSTPAPAAYAARSR